MMKKRYPWRVIGWLVLAMASVFLSSHPAFSQADHDVQPPSPKEPGGKVLQDEEAPKGSVALTKEEQAWIKEHPVLNLGTAQGYPPFDFTDDSGNYIGITPDYLDLVTKYTGLRFEVHIDKPWSETIAMAVEHELDGMTCIFENEQRKVHFNFTKAYYDSPEVVITLKNRTDIQTFNDLFGKKVAVEKDYAIEAKLKENYPEIEHYLVSNPPEALFAVSTGKADGYVGNLAVASHYMVENQLVNLQTVGQSPFKQDSLRIAIRNDWSNVPVVIINKGLDAITFKEKQAIKHKWLGIQFEETESDKAKSALASQGERLDLKGLLISVALIFGAIPLLFVIGRYVVGFLFKRLMGRDYTFGLRYVLVVGGTLFTTAVLLTAWLGLRNMEQTLRKNVGESLDVVVHSAQESLHVWYNGRRHALVSHAQDQHILPWVKQLLAMPRDKDTLNASRAQRLLRENYLMLHQSGTEGLFVIAPDRISIASMNDDNVGTVNIMARNASERIDRAFDGETVFIPPISSEVDLDSEWKTRKAGTPSMFLATPIRDEQGNILAVLTHRIDPDKDFSRIFHAGRISQSGETYAFNKDGMLLSRSRFARELKDWGLIDKEDIHGGVLALRITENPVNLLEGPAPDLPQEELPLTRMALAATSGQSGVDIEGYKDYRGVRVLGAWLWDDLLGIGLATEIDEHEALKAFTSTRIIVVAIVSFTVLLALLLVGGVLWISEHGRRSMKLARDEWERVAETRTRELKQREKKFRAIFDQTTQLMAVLDTDGVVLEVNRIAMDMVDAGLDAVIDTPFWETPWWSHAPDLQGKIKEAVTQAAGGEFIRFELTMPVPSGKTAAIDFSITPVKDENDHVLFLLPMGHDITERIKAEQAIAESEKRSRMLLESAPDAMIIVNQDGIIEGVNKQAEELFGYSRDDMLWQPIEMLVPEAVRDSHVALRDNYIGTPFHLSMGNREFFTQTKDGKVVPVDISLNPLELEDGKLVVASIRDITERKAMMRAIEEAEERSRLILDSVGEGIFGVDAQGNVSFVNPAARRMLGYSQEELVGKPLHPLIHHSYEDGSAYPSEACPMGASYRDGQVHRIADEVLWRKNGTRFPSQYTSTPIKKDGEVIGAVVAFQDITERKRVEEELKQNMEDLERFNKLAIGREEMMITLKEEINDLCERLGLSVKYRIVEDGLDEEERHV